MKLTSIAFRNIFRNRRRSALSIVAIAVSAIAITFFFALLEGIREDVRNNAWNYESGEVRLRHTEFDQYEYLNPVQYVVPEYRGVVERLRQLPSVGRVSPRIRVPSAHFRGEQQIAAIGFGLDLELERQYQDLDAIVAAGRLPEPGANEAILGDRLARELGVQIGDMVTFMTQTRQRASNAYTVDVVGLARFPVGALNQRAMIIPIESASRYMRMMDGASEILVKSARGQSDNVLQEIDAMLAAGGPEQVHAVHWSEISGGYEYLEMANVVYRIVALVFFLLAATVVISTMMMVVHERTKEIGTLAALGFNDGQLVRLFFTEAAYLGAFGALLGVVLGVAIVLPVSIVGLDFGTAIEGVDMDISTVLYPVLNVNSTVVVFFFAWFVSMAATYPSTRRAAKLKPVEALRADH